MYPPRNPYACTEGQWEKTNANQYESLLMRRYGQGGVKYEAMHRYVAGTEGMFVWDRVSLRGASLNVAFGAFLASVMLRFLDRSSA
jgi:hypothetical protein